MFDIRIISEGIFKRKTWPCEQLLSLIMTHKGGNLMAGWVLWINVRGGLSSTSEGCRFGQTSSYGADACLQPSWGGIHGRLI